MIIYRIRNTENGKLYIGSTQDAKIRKREHFNRLKRGKHPNIYLQRAWNKFGEDAFVFETIEKVHQLSDLLEREQWYLDNVIRWRVDYNIARHAGAPMRGTSASKETRELMSQVRLGKRCGEKNGMSNMTNEEVLEMIRLYIHNNYTQESLSKKYGISFGSVSRIFRGERWAYIFDLLTSDETDKLKTRLMKNKMPKEEVQKMAYMREIDGHTYVEISRVFGVSPSGASNLIKRFQKGELCDQ